MRLIKMLGLAAIAAVAAMAFLGASTASASQATLLCSNNSVLTPTEAQCGPVKKVHFVSTTLPPRTDTHGILLGSVNVLCNALLSAETTQLLAPAGTRVNFNTNVNLTYTNCLSGFHVLVLKQGHVLVLKTAPGLAEVTAGGFEVLVLGNGLNCDYNAENLVGHGLDMADGLGHVTYTNSNVNLKEKLGGFLPCPSAGALDVLFKSLTPLYVKS